MRDHLAAKRPIAPAPTWRTWVGAGVVRLLAVIDAVFVQALALAWIAMQPGASGPLWMPIVVVLVIWAVRRAGRALFDFENYGWMVLKVGGWLALLLGVGLVVQLWRFLSGT